MTDHDPGTCMFSGCIRRRDRSDEHAAERAAYNWHSAAKDIALSTALTINQTASLVHFMAEENIPVTAYDFVPAMIRLQNADTPDAAMQALVELLQICCHD